MTPPEVAAADAKADAPQLEILSGNEAIARGTWEAGVRFASAYPGTPSTEIMEAFAKYDDVYAEWAPNEKVAVEAATGAALAGARALATMKHVGLNVAADPFFSSPMIHMAGGLVIVSADDPAMHSQSRRHAKGAVLTTPLTTRPCRLCARSASIPSSLSGRRIASRSCRSCSTTSRRASGVLQPRCRWRRRCSPDLR